MNIVIRVDADQGIGMGHFMRCLALAQAWQETGAIIMFRMVPPAAQIRRRLHQEGLRLQCVEEAPGSKRDADALIDAARQAEATWVVIDGYHFDTHYHRAVKDAALQLLLIDDEGRLEHVWADVLLNQNLHATPQLYPRRQAGTRLLLGSPYVLLRREFLRYPVRPRHIPAQAAHLLVTLGGADPHNVALRVVNVIEELDLPAVQVTILAGAVSPHMTALREATARLCERGRCVQHTTDMAAQMCWADLALTAGGSTCWESAYLGLPALVVVLAANQAPIAATLADAGCIRNAGPVGALTDAALGADLVELVQDPELRRRMSRAGPRLIDGRGSARVVEAVTAAGVAY